MAVISASCTLEAHLAIGSQTYVATDYVAVGYFEHSISSEFVFLGTANISSTLSISVTAQETPETATANLSSTATVSADADVIALGTATVTSTSTTTVAAGAVTLCTATFGGELTSLTASGLVLLPFGVHGRPSRNGNSIIRRSNTESFHSVTPDTTVEFINDEGVAENNFMFMDGTQLQTTLGANDPFTLDFYFKPAIANDSSSSTVVPTRVFEYFNKADNGNTYIYIDISPRGPTVDTPGYSVGYRYADNGASFTIDKQHGVGLDAAHHFAITYDGNTGGNDTGTVQFYFDGKYVIPTAGQFTTDSAGENRPSTTWTPPSHATSEWRFGNTGSSSNAHFFMDDIRLTKGILFPREPSQSGGSSVPRFTPPAGNLTIDDITSDTVFLINAQNRILAAEVEITPTVTVATTAKEFIGAIVDITSTSSASITAVEVPESAVSTIASTSSLTVAPRVDFAGTVNLTPSVNVSVTAQEVIEQASVSMASTATVTTNAVKTVVSTATIPITTAVNVTALEVPESVTSNISSVSELTVNAGKVGEALAPINATSTLTVTGTVGLTVVTQNINMPSALTLNVSGDRIRLGTTTITSTSNVATTAVETPETTSTTIASTLNVTVAGVRQPLATVNITSTPGLVANIIPNVFRILEANTLKIPKQTRTFAVPQQDKTTVIPKQTRVNTVNKQTRILPIPKQTRVLEIET